MGYPIYKLLRAVNRQYPNNGFINYVDVREDMYDSFTNQMIDEDLRDLINETIQEVYKDVAIDEVYSFPTVPGQNQYVLPEDCDLRDIQEVTRTFSGVRGPLPPPPPIPGPEPEPGPGPGPEPTEYVTASFDANGGTGSMPNITVDFLSTLLLPECYFVAPYGYTFEFWQNSDGFNYEPGSQIIMSQNETFKAIWKEEEEEDEMKSIVTAFLDNDSTSSTESTVEKIVLETSENIGEFVFDEDFGWIEIPVESQITRVKVSATIQYEVNTTNSGINRYFYVCKADVNDSVQILESTFVADEVQSGTVYNQVNFTPFLVEVAPGDKIYIATMSPSSTTRKIVGDKGTYLTVEEMKVPVDNGDGGNGDNPIG